MERLTNKNLWDNLYNKQKNNSRIISKEQSFYKGSNRYFRNYYEFLLWNVALENYLPKGNHLKVLEVGSAPGEFLVKMHHRFSYIPYGVEYSEPGVAHNKATFESNSLNPDNVIHADFFDKLFQEKYTEFFDIVVSRGFIEHFTDIEGVLNNHLNLLKRGGYLVITIPNLHPSSFYGRWSSLFYKERLEIHNTDIMSINNFIKIFDREDLSDLFCGYFGTIHLGLLAANKSLFQRAAVSACCRFQGILNPFLNLLFQNKGFENPFWSPILLYIGKKA